MNMNHLKHDFQDGDAVTAAGLAALAGRIGATYADGVGVNHVDGHNLPRRAEVVAITELLLEVLVPGFNDRRQLRREDVAGDVEQLLKEI